MEEAFADQTKADTTGRISTAGDFMSCYFPPPHSRGHAGCTTACYGMHARRSMAVVRLYWEWLPQAMNRFPRVDVMCH